MSSPFAPEFLAAARRRLARRMATLVEVEFPDAPGGAVTLRASNRPIRPLPDGTVYEAGLKCDPIRDRIELLGGGPSPSSTTIRIQNRPWAALGGLTTFQSLAAK